MTIYATLILECMGSGFRLKIPLDKSPAYLVDEFTDFGKKPPHWTVRNPIGPLDESPVKELLESGLLGVITKNASNQRRGWMDMGLNGKKADFYALMQ